MFKAVETILEELWGTVAEMSPYLLFGFAVAAAISMAVPDSFFSKNLGTGIWPMLAMMAVGIPMYVCATASVPVAAAMILKGLSPGAALVFLMTGPATNAAGLVTIWKALGKRAALAYLVAAAACALASGVVLDWAIEKIDLPVGHAAHWMPSSFVQDLCGVILMGLIVATWVGRAKTRSL